MSRGNNKQLRKNENRDCSPDPDSNENYQIPSKRHRPYFPENESTSNGISSDEYHKLQYALLESKNEVLQEKLKVAHFEVKFVKLEASQKEDKKQIEELKQELLASQQKISELEEIITKSSATQKRKKAKPVRESQTSPTPPNEKKPETENMLEGSMNEKQVETEKDKGMKGPASEKKVLETEKEKTTKGPTTEKKVSETEKEKTPKGPASEKKVLETEKEKTTKGPTTEKKVSETEKEKTPKGPTTEKKILENEKEKTTKGSSNEKKVLETEKEKTTKVASNEKKVPETTTKGHPNEKKISETAIKGGYSGVNIDHLFDATQNVNSSPPVDENNEVPTNLSKEELQKVSKGIPQSNFELPPIFFATKPSSKLGLILLKAEVEGRDHQAKKSRIQQDGNRNVEVFVKRQMDLENKHKEMSSYRQIKQQLDETFTMARDDLVKERKHFI